EQRALEGEHPRQVARRLRHLVRFEIELVRRIGAQHAHGALVLAVVVLEKALFGVAAHGSPPEGGSYNRPPMAPRTERDFAEPREPARRRFMIAGEHVILRAFERDDAERCYRWMNDPNIVRTLKTRYPIAFQGEVEWLDRAMNPGANERHFAIERRDDRSHVGNASIHEIDWVSRTGWFGPFFPHP